MYQILQGLATFMMIFGGVLVVLGLISLPFEHKYKKKHGPMPGDTRAILYASLAMASLLIAVPLKVFVFKPRRPAIHNINYANLQPHREAAPGTEGRAATSASFPARTVPWGHGG